MSFVKNPYILEVHFEIFADEMLWYLEFFKPVQGGKQVNIAETRSTMSQ